MVDPSAITVRPAAPADEAAIWAVLEPVFRAGETYAVARDIGRDDALARWFAPGHEVFVAQAHDGVAGTYYLRANHAGGGDHVANAGFATATHAQGRGVARRMLEHSLARAAARGFRAMQFNFVVATNVRAVDTWTRHGFATVGRLPQAFRHPTLGFVDALVMHRTL